MYKLANSPNSIVQIFTSLCLSQVKEQLTDNLILYRTQPTSFICDGDLFTFIHNRSIILDESLAEYGVNLNFRHIFN